MSDAFPLPPRPNLEHYKKRAKDLLKACKSGDPDALRACVAEWIDALLKRDDLDIGLPRDGRRAYTAAEMGYLIDHTVQRVTKHLTATKQQSLTTCTLTRAQFAIARMNGFASWPKFVKHLEG